MKKTFRKNIIKEITQSFSRFMAILAIVALGVGFLAGLMATTPDMRFSADKYYDDTNTMDIHVVSTLGLTDNDVKAVKNISSVLSVMPAYSADALLSGTNHDSIVTKIHSIPLNNPNYQNQVVLVEGRMPEKSGEVVVEHKNLLGVTLSIGDILEVSDENTDIEKKLAVNEFEIVGIVQSALYFSVERERSTVGNGTVGLIMYAPESSFSYDIYTDIYATVNGAKGLNTFSDKYEDLIESAANKIEDISKEQIVIRHEDILNEANKELDNARAEYNDKKIEVEKELQDASDKINTGEKEIQDAEAEISAGYASLTDGQNQLDKQRSDFNALIAAQSMPDDVIDETNKKFDEAQKELDNTKLKLENAQSELTTAKLDLEKGINEYNEGKKEADEKLSDAEIKLNDAQSEINKIEMPEWYVLDRHSNLGYESFTSNAQKVEAIAKVFPIFFFLVAALVALTTMTRMVEEERTQIGTLKALGYSKSTIASKYLLYAGLASILGSIIGLLVGFKLFPTVIWNAYEMMYTLPPLITQFNVKYALMSSLAAITCTLAATFAACYSSLKETPARLMLPRAPKAGKRVFLEYVTPIWKRMKFTHKVTARNLIRYKKRFFMTVIGIAGCTALLVTGFGLRDSIGDIISKQFGEIFKYNLIVSIKNENALEKSKNLYDLVENKDIVSNYTTIHQENATATGTKNKNSVATTITSIEDESSLKEFIKLQERKTKKPIEFNENSVIVTEKLAEKLQLKIGDKITLEISENKRADFTISGITENYVTGYVYIPDKIYEEAYGKKTNFNLLIGTVPNATDALRDEISTELLKNEEVNAVSFTDVAKNQFDDLLSKIDYIVIVLIVSAGLLAFIVLYNLTNINITERQKEIATIKVLGFYDKEVSSYVYRETIILSLIGTFIGLIFGIFLHSFVVRTAEVDAAMFGRTIYPLSFVFSALLTMFFSMLVNLVMNKKLKKIDMVESMKANE